MIREAVRVVFKMDEERAINNLKSNLERLKEMDVKEARQLVKNELPFFIAEVIVSLTQEEIGVEYARLNALKNATKFANEVKTTLHRKVGRHENLLISLSDRDIYDEDLFQSSVDSFVKLISSSNFKLNDLINKGSLILASMLHIAGFSEIDVHAVKDIDTFLQ